MANNDTARAGCKLAAISSVAAVSSSVCTVQAEQRRNELPRLADIARRSVGRLIGVPQPAPVPASLPLHLSICQVALPAACLPPPGPIASRFGAGAASDQATAEALCLLEGIERYSLQYQAHDPANCDAVAVGESSRASRPSHVLRLGHPAQRDGAPPADSRGCAVGASLADAALRGLLELVEADAEACWARGEGEFRPVAAPALGAEASPLSDALREHGLALRTELALHASGTAVAVSVCSRPDGSQPATGSAAAVEPSGASQHAAIEAVVAWFNQSEMARMSAPLDHMSPGDRAAVAQFRGYQRLPAPASGTAWQSLPAAMLPSGTQAEAAFEAVRRSWGRDIAVFDLSRPETGLVTVRVMSVDR